ncbi:hypothetical protein [Catalinimonas niigatensis]|uniref:hypothetical protein n=1 Tax=Catalinimonas niigatensis TaxID=1397264 RepID=UPI0026665D95|nr:hypothetical protein [Catalinimonas niigatensis]WPP48874.1 hypothetical protein PZB72_19585 [Catalinimonas niigatensis]
MIIHAPRFVRVITGNFARAITLYPFVFVREKKDKRDKVLVNHENIHLRQQQELLLIPFYLWYLLEYFVGRMKGYNHFQAYRQISFEQEAYAHEGNLTYLKQRKFLAFRKYVKM